MKGKIDSISSIEFGKMVNKHLATVSKKDFLKAIKWMKKKIEDNSGVPMKMMRRKNER